MCLTSGCSQLALSGKANYIQLRVAVDALQTIQGWGPCTQRATRHIAYMYTLGIRHVRLRAAANAVHMGQLSMPRAALLRTKLCACVAWAPVIASNLHVGLCHVSRFQETTGEVG